MYYFDESGGCQQVTDPIVLALWDHLFAVVDACERGVPGSENAEAVAIHYLRQMEEITELT